MTPFEEGAFTLPPQPPPAEGTNAPEKLSRPELVTRTVDIIEDFLVNECLIHTAAISDRDYKQVQAMMLENFKRDRHLFEATLMQEDGGRLDWAGMIWNFKRIIVMTPNRDSRFPWNGRLVSVVTFDIRPDGNTTGHERANGELTDQLNERIHNETHNQWLAEATTEEPA